MLPRATAKEANFSKFKMSGKPRMGGRSSAYFFLKHKEKVISDEYRAPGCVLNVSVTIRTLKQIYKTKQKIIR